MKEPLHEAISLIGVVYVRMSGSLCSSCATLRSETILTEAVSLICVVCVGLTEIASY